MLALNLFFKLRNMHVILIFCLLLPIRVSATYIRSWSRCYTSFNNIEVQLEKNQNTENSEDPQPVQQEIQALNAQYKNIVDNLSQISEKEISVPYLNDIFHEQPTKDNILDYIGTDSKESTGLGNTKQKQDFAELLQLKQHLEDTILRNTMIYNQTIKKHLDRLDQKITMYNKNYIQ